MGCRTPPTTNNSEGFPEELIEILNVSARKHPQLKGGNRYYSTGDCSLFPFTQKYSGPLGRYEALLSPQGAGRGLGHFIAREHLSTGEGGSKKGKRNNARSHLLNNSPPWLGV